MNAARLTPRPSKRRRAVAEEPAQQTLPYWAGASDDGNRGGEAYVPPRRKLYADRTTTSKIIREEGLPRAKNQ